jgi:transketolase C-terminal domain/subunit
VLRSECFVIIRIDLNNYELLYLARETSTVVVTIESHLVLSGLTALAASLVSSYLGEQGELFSWLARITAVDW